MCKSHAVKAVIAKCQSEDYAIAVATPTGFLQSTYRAELIEDKFFADAIHSLFHYPVDIPKKKPCVNWNTYYRQNVYGTDQNFRAHLFNSSAIANKTCCHCVWRSTATTAYSIQRQ